MIWAALADNYGKPHSPIYDLARIRLNNIAGRKLFLIQRFCVLEMVLHTDIHGAIMENIRLVYLLLEA